jgi:hypothetical protein
MCCARYGQRLDTGRHLSPAHHLGRRFQIGQSAIGAGADERDIDLGAGDLLPGLQVHVAERAFGHVAPPGVGEARWRRHHVVDRHHILWRIPPGDLRLQYRAVDVECGRRQSP